MAGGTRAASKPSAAPDRVMDRVLPAPRVVEVDSVDLAMSLEDAWELIRHGEILEQSPFVRGVFAIRRLPARFRSLRPSRGGGANQGEEQPRHRIDDLLAAPGRPGFHILAEDPPREVVAGAVARVRGNRMRFLDIPSADTFRTFDEPDSVKLAWAIRLVPFGPETTRVTMEVRVDASDEEAWRAFRRYLRMFGSTSRMVRRQLLAGLEREHGTREREEAAGRAAAERALPGDELLPDADHVVTEKITIRARPEQVWPWLVQMGCHRAGFYGIDVLDNGGRRSAREIHPELQDLRVGDVLPATPRGDLGLEVLQFEPNRALVLAGLFDVDGRQQLPFSGPRPERYWQLTWAFVLDPLDGRTRLTVRAKGASAGLGRMGRAWKGALRRWLQFVQLRHLRDRAEGRVGRDDWRDVGEGVTGAGVMAAGLVTPFLRPRRRRWGVNAAAERATHPGDELVAEPRWGFTHGVEIDASVEEVWPWVTQIGSDRAGFYSYQWLGNLAGGRLRNAEALHPEWALHEGDELRLHPKLPPMRVVTVDPNRALVAYYGPDQEDLERAKPWAATSWLLQLEPLDAHRTRLVSRYRSAFSDDRATRLGFGPTFREPISFALDRRMLLGIKSRAERAHRRFGLPRPRRG
ncbi:hypothetical protein [Actinopolymorpha alba]|uniref:hypothetical protein n=1 Tax=Actinopolymorpha alba TaxID=533267 RepID=UPI00037E4AC8|nr:hypothetical protein [Actinopolymorpha alba]